MSRHRPGAYYCGWAITGRATAMHLIASPDFPTAGSQRRAWCGETITVIGLTLNARRAPGSCDACNRHLQWMVAVAIPAREELDARHGAATAQS